VDFQKLISFIFSEYQSPEIEMDMCLQ